MRRGITYRSPGSTRKEMKKPKMTARNSKRSYNFHFTSDLFNFAVPLGKFEIRISKYETIAKFKGSNYQNDDEWPFEFVSELRFRIPDLSAQVVKLSRKTANLGFA